MPARAERNYLPLPEDFFMGRLTTGPLENLALTDSNSLASGAKAAFFLVCAALI